MRVYSFIQVLKSISKKVPETTQWRNFKESFINAGQQQLTVAFSNWKVKDILNNFPWYQKRVIFVASLCCHPALVNISWWPCYLAIFDNKSFSFNLKVFLSEDAWFFGLYSSPSFPDTSSSSYLILPCWGNEKNQLYRLFSGEKWTHDFSLEKTAGPLICSGFRVSEYYY